MIAFDAYKFVKQFHELRLGLTGTRTDGREVIVRDIDMAIAESAYEAGCAARQASQPSHASGEPGQPDEYPVCSKHRIYFTKDSRGCWICNVDQHNHGAVEPPQEVPCHLTGGPGICSLCESDYPCWGKHAVGPPQDKLPVDKEEYEAACIALHNLLSKQRELVTKWRNSQGCDWNGEPDAWKVSFNACADELEAAAREPGASERT